MTRKICITLYIRDKREAQSRSGFLRTNDTSGKPGAGSASSRVPGSGGDAQNNNIRWVFLITPTLISG